ncbi:TolC family protein [Thiomicrorhabdus sediminis]|uniref:TolC family protein n=1 Tax=Thiomicrorhabdus sediminis TaxID=2580412 RepID=A0A4P9K973_9GAMM|nr:TolC family protein [Thiomicrorhabdus sediminis]QCU90986.1 TolC family protein [Thiomicrorhabdus sediminis]
MKTSSFRPTLWKITVVLSVCLCSKSALAIEPLSDITLKQAIKNTLDNNPELKEYPFKIRYQKALSRQAEIKPTPQISLEIENILGTQNYSLGEQSEITLTLSQNFELGEKLFHRLALSQSKEDSNHLEFELAKLDIAAETSRRFYEVVYLQQLSRLINENLSKQKLLYKKINRLAQEGIADPVDQSRIKLLLKQSNHHLLSISKQNDLAKIRLSAMWQSDIDFDNAVGLFDSNFHTPSKAGLLNKIETSPSQLHYLALQRMADNNLKLEKAKGVQDITFGVGIKHKNSDAAQTINFGMSMPLAFNNPNQGRIEAAKIKLQESRTLQKESTQKLKLKITEYWMSLKNIEASLQDIDSQLVPESEKLLTTSLAAYQRGTTSLLQVMEAQQILFELRTKQLDLNKQRQLVLLEIERLVGTQPIAQ